MGFGQQGYGYNVAVLYNEIGKILGLDKDYNIIIIGAGNLGQALANYARFENRGFYVKALFDTNPEKIGMEIRDSKVYALDDLADYLKNNRVDIAALAIPKESAVKVAATLVENGIRAIWNFAHTDLHVPENVHVQNVHLVEGLMQLSYKLASDEEKSE